MLGRAVSPVFVGREKELALLLDSFDRARRREASAVLIGGEAGVGKTRLTARFAELAAEQKARVLVGGCVELSSDGLAYAPFTAALRQLVRETGADEVTALLPDGAARDLARLLPEFGEPTGERETDTGRARLFEQFLTLLERLAEQRPVLLVIEDVHWADRSSRDLIAFLSRNLLTPQVLMVLTYRSDELHRQHPLRPVLTRLGRNEGVLRLELPRLTRDEVAAQMAGILGTTPEYAHVGEVYDRSEGIPLFVEALVDHDGDAPVPLSLHDLLVDAFERMPERTQSVLRVAAAGGTRVGHALLAAVSGLSDVDLEDALRPAIAANVIQIADGDTYAFRHSLIREAVHDELLPGEHLRIHARYAEEIERDRRLVPPGRAAFEIAHHWHSAGDDLWAFISAWEAAGQAAKTFAYTEQIQLLKRVLTLWDKVPDAAERLGTDQAGVLELGAEAAFASGDVERGVKFVNAALDRLDERTQAERVALLLALRSQLRLERGRTGVLEDLRRAAALVPRPGPARAHVLERLGRKLMLRGDVVEGTALVQETLRLAHELGDESLRCDLLLDLAIGQCLDGDPEGALATDRKALEIAEKTGSGRLVLRALCNSVDVLNNLGRTDEALRIAEEAETLARRYGRYRIHMFAVVNRAETLEAAGRWDEAEARITHALAKDPTVLNRHHLLRVRCEIALGRGEDDLAERILREIGALQGPPELFTQEAETGTRLLVGWHLLRGDVAAALAAAGTFFDLRPPSSKPMLGWRLLTYVEEACWAASAVDPAGAAALRGRAEAFAEDMRAGGPVGEAFRLTYRGDFDAAAIAWQRLGRPYLRAKALTRAAHAAARAGDRDGAGARLREAMPLVTPLGARPLIAEIETLARRVGVTPDPGNSGTSTANGRRDTGELTPRELEVLRLVAMGLSNRDIAGELFISAKTVSVHVSKILAKLGVATRSEAAATAHRRSLLN